MRSKSGTVRLIDARPPHRQAVGVRRRSTTPDAPRPASVQPALNQSGDSPRQTARCDARRRHHHLVEHAGHRQGRARWRRRRAPSRRRRSPTSRANDRELTGRRLGVADALELGSRQARAQRRHVHAGTPHLLVQALGQAGDVCLGGRVHSEPRRRLEAGDTADVEQIPAPRGTIAASAALLKLGDSADVQARSPRRDGRRRGRGTRRTCRTRRC